MYINVYIYIAHYCLLHPPWKKNAWLDPGNLQPTGPFLRPGTLRHRDTCDRDAWPHPGCAGGLSRATWADIWDLWDLAHGDVGMGSKLIKWQYFKILFGELYGINIHKTSIHLYQVRFDSCHHVSEMNSPFFFGIQEVNHLNGPWFP